ncbi:MAG TPA: hypothetical protein VF345_15160 [Chthoniobacterales bacterium]
MPLWVLFVAVQLLDFLWAPFVLLGIEKVRMVPGITATNALDLYYMPYTHSLVAALVWSGLAALVYKFASGAKASRAVALIVAFAVFSHWILDLVVHRPDLAIYDDTLKVGLGLWNYRGLEFGVEIAILVGGILLYLKRNNSVARKVGIVAFGVVLILIQAGNTFVSRPISSDRVFAITTLVFYTLFAGIAFLLEKRRSRTIPKAFANRGSTG